MFEFDKYDEKLHAVEPAASVIAYQPATNVTGMSLLFWAEHCVACAAPGCYSTCDLYSPRADLRCRRLAFGAYKNTSFKSIRGYGVEVCFKQWGKMECFGNTAVYPMPSVLRLERLIEHGAPLTNALGRLMNKATGSFRWAELTYTLIQKLEHTLHRRGIRGTQPDCFLLEVYNPAQEEVRLQVIFSVLADRKKKPEGLSPLIPPVINTVPLPPGYSSHEFEGCVFRKFLDSDLPFKITLIPEADNYARLVFLTADLVTLKKPAASKDESGKVKCVVWDLDNTLWDGTLIEGDDVALRPAARDLLKYLDERGILSSIASKNDFSAAWQKLQEFGIADYFLYPQIDWSPKSENIRTIAGSLNIGLDTLAFIDDSPFELDQVSQALPRVACIRADHIDALRSDPRFRGAVTEESRQRRRFYQDEITRRKNFSDGDYLQFLASCEILLEIADYAEKDHERVAELVQRTNQLNFSGRKYSRIELDEIINDAGLEKLVLRCSDKYGSYGTVGFCIIRGQGDCLEVLDFMLSCRVQGKFIEQALLNHVFEHHNSLGSRSLWVNFRPTERNKPAQSVLESLGFRPRTAENGNGDKAHGMVLSVSEQPLRCDFIAVRCSMGSDAAATGDKAPVGIP